MDICDKNLAKVKALVENFDVYLYGIGFFGGKSHDFLRANFNLVGAFDSKYKEDTDQKLGGLKVLGTNRLKSLDKERTAFIVTSSYWEEIRDSLQALGFKHVFSIFKIYRNDIFKFFPPVAAEYENKIAKLRAMLADEKSQTILDKIIAKRNSQEMDYSDILETPQYFVADLVKTTDLDSVVDAGAYDGDTIEVIRKLTDDKFSKIYAFEPDEQNFKRMKAKNDSDARIVLCPKATWNETTDLYINDGQDTSTTVTAKGSVKIAADTIDSVVRDNKVTLIKMDVEGAERESLLGAINTIKRDKPVLTICVYHLEDDLWEIPFLIKKIMPEYKLSLRHHSHNWMETVIYAYI